MKILIDNGHGNDTPGKRSPDGRLLEWAYTREIADRVAARLQSAVEATGTSAKVEDLAGGIGFDMMNYGITQAENDLNVRCLYI